jgi:hypothetical protein
MFKKSIFFLFGLMLCFSVSGQTVKDSILIVKSGGSTSYVQAGEILTFEKMQYVMRNNQDAISCLNNAKGSSGFASVLGYAGGFLIGYPIGTALGGGQANWTMALIGCGIVLVAIPIASGANANIRKAIDLYNKDRSVSNTLFNDYDLKLGVTQDGIGLILKF